MFSIVGSEALGRFNEHFGLLMLRSAVESIIGHWPQEFKDNITRDAFNKLNYAEIEYSSSKDFIWNKDVELDSITGNSLLAKLTRNIAINCGYELFEYKPGINLTESQVDIMDINLKVSAAFMEVMDKMKLRSLIIEVANAVKKSS